MNLLGIIISVIFFLALGLLFTYIFKIVSKERKLSQGLTSQVSKLKSENSNLKRELFSTTERFEKLNEELVVLKHKFITTSQEIDPRDLKVGDVFFSEEKKGNLYYVTDIKEISFRLEDVIHGGSFNLQYPFDTSRCRYFKVTNVINTEERDQILKLLKEE